MIKLELTESGKLKCENFVQHLKAHGLLAGENFNELQKIEKRQIESQVILNATSNLSKIHDFCNRDFLAELVRIINFNAQNVQHSFFWAGWDKADFQVINVKNGIYC